MSSFVFYCNLTKKHKIFHQRETIVDFESTSEADLLARMFSAQAIVLFCDDENIPQLKRFLQLAGFCRQNFFAKPKIAAIAIEKSQNVSYFAKYFGNLLVVLQNLTDFENQTKQNLQKFFQLAELENFYCFDIVKRAEIAKKHLENHTQKELAKKLNMSRSALANLVRLCNLPQSSKDLLTKNAICEGHARCLLGLTELQQKQCSDIIIKEKISVRKTEHIRRNLIF